MRDLTPVETFEMKGRGTAYVVRAPEPPFEIGEVVLLDGDVPMKIVAMEMQPTTIPRYVINGFQAVLLKDGS